MWEKSFMKGFLPCTEIRIYTANWRRSSNSRSKTAKLEHKAAQKKLRCLFCQRSWWPALPRLPKADLLAKIKSKLHMEVDEWVWSNVLFSTSTFSREVFESHLTHSIIYWSPHQVHHGIIVETCGTMIYTYRSTYHHRVTELQKDWHLCFQLLLQSAGSTWAVLYFCVRIVPHPKPSAATDHRKNHRDCCYNERCTFWKRHRIMALFALISGGKILWGTVHAKDISVPFSAGTKGGLIVCGNILSGINSMQHPTFHTQDGQTWNTKTSKNIKNKRRTIGTHVRNQASESTSSASHLMSGLMHLNAWVSFSSRVYPCSGWAETTCVPWEGQFKWRSKHFTQVPSRKASCSLHPHLLRCNSTIDGLLNTLGHCKAISN